MVKPAAVSIITVCYNALDYIESAIESVLAQSYENIEYIIIDGGSNDGTVEIIKQYKDKISCFISEPDKGIYDAMNKGIKLATGDIIGILNSDDFYPNSAVIYNVVQALKLAPNADMILGNVCFSKANNLSKIVRFYPATHFSSWKLRFGFMPPHPSAFIKKSVYDKVGYYKSNYKTAADFDLFVRMMLVHKLSYQKLNQTLVQIRMGGVSTSGLKSYIMTTKELLRSLKENQVYSNIAMIIMRLPIKFLPVLFRKIAIYRDNESSSVQ